MLQEYISYLFHSVSCPSYLKKLKFLHEIIGIQARHRRHKEAWAEHLQNTKEEIKTAVSKLENKRGALILGAGLCLDVPLEFLNDNFQEVILVDVFFLQSAIDEIKKYPNIGFIEEDLTAVLEDFYYLQEKLLPNQVQLFDERLKNLCHKKPQFFLNQEGIDFVASVNLCSQLYHSSEAALERKGQSLQYAELFYRSLIENHIEYLQQFRAKGSEVLLLTDVEKIVKDSESKILAADSSLQNLDFDNNVWLQKNKEWLWQLAPIGEIDPGHSLELKVVSYGFRSGS